MATLPNTAELELDDDASEELAIRGWRLEPVVLPDGGEDYQMVPLTEEEYLHPKEGYHLPNSTFHDTVAATAKDMLRRRYEAQPTVGVYGDLLIKWGIRGLGDHCPDAFVAFGVRKPTANRRRFMVAKEGVRPALIIEVVSPHYRKADREKKVFEYARAKVPEYLIIDRREQRGQVIDDVLGYRLVGGRYLPIAPDEDGRVLCQTVGLWFSMQDGELVLEDSTTGERLLTSSELERYAYEQEARAREQEARAREQEARALAEQEARQAAEAQNAALRAQLEALQAELRRKDT